MTLPHAASQYELGPDFVPFSPDEQVLSRAVVIIGAGGRTGTSMLGRILSRHPDVSYSNEPRLVWRWGNDRRSDLLHRSDARPDVRAHIRSVFARRVRDEGKPRFLEKTPANSLRMEFVDAILPDCRFIHIMRNPVDAILGIRSFWTNYSRGLHTVDLRKRLLEVRLSQLPFYAREMARRVLPARLVRPNIWGPRIPGIEEMVAELDVLEVAALQWRTCVELACHAGRRMPPDRYLEIQLEDMSHELLSRVLSFAELDDDLGLHAYLDEHYDPHRPGRRRQQAVPEDLERIERWIEPTRRWLGYG